MEINEIIKEKIKEKKLKYRDVTNYFGWNYNGFCHFIRGHRNYKFDRIMQLLDFFELEIRDKEH